MDLSALARPEILAMRPYASARSSMSADGILLNANEAPRALLDDPDLTDLELNRYPAPQPAALRERLAELYEVPGQQILITRGSDEGIDLLLRVFCRPGADRIVECTPCFGMYRVAAAIQGAGVVDAPRNNDLRIDAGAVCDRVSADNRVRLVFLTTPNNPTGDLLPPADLRRILDACDNRALVVLDEAYIEFTGAKSAAALVSEYPQLVVLRTLSKAWAAAALRCGTVIARPEVIGLLGRVMAPYPLTAPAVAAALRITDPALRERQRDMLADVMAQKQAFLDLLEQLPWVQAIWPGEANFVLTRVEDAAALTAWCEHHGIRIRNFDGQPRLDSCVRFSVGTADEMQALATALRNFGAR